MSADHSPQKSNAPENWVWECHNRREALQTDRVSMSNPCILKKKETRAITARVSDHLF